MPLFDIDTSLGYIKYIINRIPVKKSLGYDMITDFIVKKLTELSYNILVPLI